MKIEKEHINCNYVKYAKNEFKTLGWDKTKDEMQQLICKHIIKLLEVFSKEGHSGYSAPYTINLFKKLASFEPISPLTGKDEEWTKIADNLWQNKRSYRIFKVKEGKKTIAHDMDGKVFREPNGHCYTNAESIVYIKFPYTPKTEYIDVKLKGDLK